MENITLTKKILVTLAVMVAALLPMVMVAQPAAADINDFTCYDSNKNIDDYYTTSGVIGGDFNIRFRLHIDYNHCVSVVSHYDVVHGYVASVTHLGENRTCGAMREFWIDPGALSGRDRAKYVWTCQDNNETYTFRDSFAETVWGSDPDRCVAFKWTIERPWYNGDISDTSPTGCLG